MKHLSYTGKGKKPLWLLYALAAVAVVLAIIALVKTAGSLDLGLGPTEGPSQPAAQGQTTAPPPATTAPPASESDLAARRQTLLADCQRLLDGYFYPEAIEQLSQAGELQNGETDALLARARELKAALVPYAGEQYYHVFFHSLILDTAKAFDGDHRAQGYNEYMTTRSEFEKMLPIFLEDDFILYDIKEMVEIVDGKAVRKPIYLPPGKKPLVISIDDVCYYDYMKTDGFADRLDVDADGRVVTVVKDDRGQDQVTYDGDVMPILDSFVAEHPEFSFRGYKGIVAVTGYQGAFGYRITDLGDYDAETGLRMQNKVREVSDALRATGWDIACHSFTHNAYWSKKTITEAQFNHYEKRWNEEIAPYLGQVDIFIAPNGAYLGRDHWATQRLVAGGYYIYCPVGSGMFTSFQDGFMLQDRLNLDGLNMIKYPERVRKFFFEPSRVLDPARPPLK